MKIARLASILTLILLSFTAFLGAARAQGPVELNWTVIKLWPEYDDPRLLVIVDGELATPDSELRIPIPQEAQLNAVATADDSGRLLTNEWREEKGEHGERLLVLTPQFPAFRIEYYAPLAINGAQRIIDFELPGGYVNVKDANIEVLLPPSSQNVQLDPPADAQDAAQEEAHLFQRSLGEVQNQAIRQKITYDNPSGALTAPESATTSGTQPQATPAPVEEPAAAETAASSLNPWLLLLGAAALVLIIGGAVGLWLTREHQDAASASSPAGETKRKTRRASVQVAPNNLDRYCRNCGKEFGPDDRYCRYCGAKRQTIR